MFEIGPVKSGSFGPRLRATTLEGTQIMTSPGSTFNSRGERKTGPVNNTDVGAGAARRRVK